MEGRNAATVPGVNDRSRLTWWRRAARAVLWAEFTARAAWAALAVFGAAIGLALLGFSLGGVVGPALFTVVTIAAVGLCLRQSVRGTPRPSRSDADRRLEHDSGLSHRPLMVLQDQPAGMAGEPGLWQLHHARAEAALRRLRLALPSPGLPRRDPAALRILSLLILIAGIMVAGDDAIPRLRRAFLPSFDSGTPVPVTLQAWVEPPGYTGMAPIFLPTQGGNVQVPEGAKLNVSLTGVRFKPSLSGAAANGKFHALGDESWRATGILRLNGALRVSRFLFSPLTAWNVSILANDPPEVNWAGPPGQAGKSLELNLPWHVSQRWGVAGLRAQMVPAGHPDLPAIDLSVPLPGTPKNASGSMRIDLSANPLAGVKMDGTLTARDVSGQETTSAPAHFVLPVRIFHNGLARAIVDLRRRLALHDERPMEAAADLDALTMSPGGFSGHSGLYLNIVSVAALLRENPPSAGIADAQARMWIVALALDGALPEPSQVALDRAKDALRQALKERAEGRKNESEVAREIRKLADALAQRLADIAQKAVKDGKIPPFDPRTQHFHMPSLDKLLREMQTATENNRPQEAQQKLAEIESLLDKLQTAKILTPKQAQQAEQAAKQGKQQTGAVQDMVQREGGLMDSAQHRAPRPSAMAPQFNPEGLEPPPDPDELEATEEARAADAKTQRALSRALDALKSAFGAGGGKVPGSMDNATKDMGEATQALTAGQESAARQAEARAIADLQKGGKSMSQQMAANSQMAIVPAAGQPGEEGDEMSMDPGGQDENGQRDPLGRPLRQGMGGKTADDGSVKVPDEMEQGRSRAIQDELRRREADKERKREELDYIDRLLKPY
jgi:uncharacterized protein (TIGR02302 family)